MKMISLYLSKVKGERAVFFKLDGKHYKSSINTQAGFRGKQFWPNSEQKELLKQEAITASLGCMMPLADADVKTLVFAGKRVAYAK